MTAILALLGKVPLRWWLYAAGAAAVSFILWREHHAVHLAKKLATEKAAVILELDQARATIDTMKVDAALNKETSRALAQRNADLERDRRDNPIRGVFLCPPARGVHAATEGGATSGNDDARDRRESQPPAEDLGPALEQYGADCAAIAGRLTTLQEWEAARTH